MVIARTRKASNLFVNAHRRHRLQTRLSTHIPRTVKHTGPQVCMSDNMSPFDPIELLGSHIPFADPFSFVDGEFGEWPEPASESRSKRPTPLPANPTSRRVPDVELVRIQQSERWRKAGLNRLVGACAKLESSYFEESDDHAVASTDGLMLLHQRAQSSSHAPHTCAPASLAWHTVTRNSRDVFTPDACPFLESKEESDVCSYGNLNLAKQGAGASPSLFDLGSQMPRHHVEFSSPNAACNSGSLLTSSRRGGSPMLTEDSVNSVNHRSEERNLETFVHPLPVVLAASVPGRARLNAEQAIHIFNQRATKTRHTAALLAAEYGISSKAIRDIWTRRSWAEDTRPFWTHLDEELPLGAMPEP